MTTLLLGLLGLLLASTGAFAEGASIDSQGPAGQSAWKGTTGGDVKTFVLAFFPYDSSLLPADPWGSGMLTLRLKAEGGWEKGGYGARLVVHGAGESRAPGASVAIGSLGTSPSTTVPEAVDLSWSEQYAGLAMDARFDRMVMELKAPHVGLAAGRQAISFGHGQLFTPFDLVAPFSPAVIDQEYKPGFDALRLDAYSGRSTKFTAAAAYAGSWDRSGIVAAGYGQTTVGAWDLGALLGSIHGDIVGGFTSSGSLGPLGLWGEATVTHPTDDTDDFVRAVVGGNARPGDRTMVSCELYVQTVGAGDPADYLVQAIGPRYSRGELWALGRYYAGASGSYDLSPLVTLRAFAVVNLADPSAMVGPGISWSVADNASVIGGVYLGLGQRPGNVANAEPAVPSSVPVRSEFGLVPTTAYISMASHF